MLRIDNSAEFVKVPWTLGGLFSGRYAVRRGKKILSVRWKAPAFEAIRETQDETPIALLRDGRRTLWHFRDCFYWEDEGLANDDVKALALQRERRKQQKLQTAHTLMQAQSAGRPTRVPIPAELRRRVFERDGGVCVECGSNFDLQYDHVLPVAHGGATTFQNLQILCADCNHRKSDSI